MSENDMKMESIVAQYIPEIIYSDISNKNEFNDHNFLFSQLEWTDNLEEDYRNNDENGISLSNYDDFMTDNNNWGIYFDEEFAKFSKEMDEQNKLIEEQNEEAENASKMLNYLISIEVLYTPDWDYIERIQSDISPLMRAILLDWMMEVCNEFTLKRETFFYSVNYVDRFLSVHPNVK